MAGPIMVGYPGGERGDVVLEYANGVSFCMAQTTQKHLGELIRYTGVYRCTPV